MKQSEEEILENSLNVSFKEFLKELHTEHLEVLWKGGEIAGEIPVGASEEISEGIS